MKKLVKRVISLSGVVALSTGLLAGCNSKTEDTPKDTDSSKEIREITVMLFDRGTPIPEGQGTLTDNRWTKWVNEQLNPQGVAVKYVTIPRSEETAKVPVLMASGTAPDVTYHYTSQNVYNFYKDGGIYKLNEYIDKYGPDIKANIGEEAMASGTTAEGDIYAVMSKRAIRNKFNQYIRKDWLDKLKMPVPTTIDELYKTLVAFKTEDPGGVGKNKVIPAWLSYSTQYSFVKYVTEKDYFVNSVNHWKYLDPGYKDALKWQNKLYNEGLIPAEYFADTGGQKKKEAFASGTLGYTEDNFAFDVLGNYGSLSQNLAKNVPGAEFIAIPPMKNVNDGKVYNAHYPASGLSAFVPKTCKYPEAAVKYMNFLAGDGGKTLMYGIEGEHYKLVDGAPITIDANYNTGKGWLVSDIPMLYSLPTEKSVIATAKSLGEYEKHFMKDFEIGNLGIVLKDNAVKTPKDIEKVSGLGKVHSDYQVKLITCKPSEFDSLYAAFQADLKKAGVDEVTSARLEYWNKMKK